MQPSACSASLRPWRSTPASTSGLRCRAQGCQHRLQGSQGFRWQVGDLLSHGGREGGGWRFLPGGNRTPQFIPQRRVEALVSRRILSAFKSSLGHWFAAVAAGRCRQPACAFSSLHFLRPAPAFTYGRSAGTRRICRMSQAAALAIFFGFTRSTCSPSVAIVTRPTVLRRNS